MITKWKCILIVVGTTLATSIAHGQELNVTTSFTGDGGIVAVSGTAKPVDATAAGDAGGYVFDLSLDSTADILIVDAAFSDVVGTIYNPIALDSAPPTGCIFLCDPPIVEQDLWVTTPGATGAVDASSLIAGETVTHFDTTDDGAQSGFHWASVPLIPNEQGYAMATLNARFQTAALPTPVFDDVTVVMTIGTVPEPAGFGLAIVALLGGIGLVRSVHRRRP